MYNCEKCHKEFSLKQSKTNHEKYCNGHGIKKRRGPKYIKCEKCGEDVISQGFKKHNNYCTGEGILNKKRYTGKGRDWAKNISKTEEQKNKISKSLTGFKHTKENCDKLSKILKSKTGGIRKGGGRGKSGWYKGLWCDSSWELAYVIYNLDHNIRFERNKRGFEYIFNNKKYKYYPDFILNGEYVEIKGYLSEQVNEKIKQFPYKLNILDKDGIIFYLDYVKKKYGNDFIKLYEEAY